MNKKLTALILSILMVGSMVSTPISALAAETDELPSQSEVTVDDVSFAVGEKKLPEASGETFVSGDFEYTVDESTNEVTITKYSGSDTAVVIPEKIDNKLVVALGDYLFRENKMIKEVTMPKSLTSIGRETFALCDRLETADIPDSVTTIRYQAFYRCAMLPTLDYPKNLKSIEERVWAECPLITEAKVPEGIENLPNCTFSGCEYLRSVELPDSLVSIGENAFRNCKSLRTVTIPDNVETIGKNAFDHCEAMTSVKFPSKLVSLGYAAFYECQRLETADVPDSVEYIDAYAFENCRRLASFTYPKKLEKANESIFKNCEKLTEITVPEGVEQIPGLTFKYANCLEKINLPSTLKKIGNSAFYGCSALKSVELPENLEAIEEAAFEECASLRSFTFPDSFETVSGYVLKNCKQLESVSLPASARSIGNEALLGCERLKSIVLPENVESIGIRAFAHCKKLESVTLPVTWEEAGYNIFENCENLTEITVPEGVKKLPNYAFQGATYLEKLNLPSTLTTIGEKAVSECKNLKTIELPDSLKTIGNEAFRSSGFTEFTLPDSVTEIPDNMIRECSDLEKFTFPKNLKKIGRNAFYRCVRLTELDIPDSVESIGEYAFEECTKLTSFHYPKNWETAFGSTFKNCPGITELVIPEGITSVPDKAFSYCNCIESVKFPSTMKSIGASAFFECTALTDIEFSDSIKTIGTAAFERNSALTQVTLPEKLETLGGWVFKDCPKLENVTFNDKLKTIGEECFRNDTRLASAKLPNTVEKLGRNAFTNCKSLNEFDYPVKLEEAGEGIFEACESLNSITIPEGVKAIPANTFRYSRNLQTVSLPTTLTTIGENAFADCDLLNEITLSSKVTNISDSAFRNCPSLTVFTPKYMKSVVNMIDKKINVISNDDERHETDKVLDAKRSSYAMLSGSRIAVSCAYSMKSSVYSNVSNAAVRFYIPDGASVVNLSLYHDGELCTDFSENGNYLIIPVEKQNGRITFNLEAQADCSLVTYAILTYRLGSTDDFDIIDILNEDHEIITLSADDVISSSEIEISGIAPVESSVTVFADGSQAATVNANKGGMYCASLDLGMLQNNKRIKIRVETVNKDGDIISASKTVRYVENAPALTSFEMDYNGLSYNLLSGKKHNVTFVLEAPHQPTPFTFHAKYENTKNIDRVYITSTRNQVTKRMLAKYDASTGTYVAKGYFDPDNHDYVPGKIGVEYIEKPVKNDYSINDLEKVYNGDMLPEVLKNAVHEQTVDEENLKVVVIKTEDDDYITYTYERLYASDFKADYEKRNNVHSSKTDIEGLVKDYGWQSRTDGGVTVYAEFDKNVSGNETIAWSWCSDHVYVEKETIEFGSKSARKKALMHVSEEDLDRVIESGLNYAETDNAEYIFCNGYTVNYTNARASIISSTATPAEKNRKLAQLDELRRVAIEMTAVKLIGAYLNFIGEYRFGDHPILTNVIFVMDMWLFNFGFTTGGGDTPGGEGPGGVGTPDEPGDETDDEPDDGDIGDIADPGSSTAGDTVAFAIDPSGFVYEAVTDNRIAGAKVTAYWIPFDGENESYWNDPDESKAVVWDSEEYSQINPLYTDNTGNYAWDVPEGWWKIVVEADGYEKAESDWMPVPPPQTEVNIGLVSLEAPKVESVEKISDTEFTVTFSKYIDPETANKIVVLDKNGATVEFTVDYSYDERDADGNVFTKKVTVKLEDPTSKITVKVGDGVRSYCDVPAESYSAEVRFSDEPDGPGPEPVEKGTYGDVDGDGNITSSDALAILRASVGLTEFSGDASILADVDGDGMINSSDALIVLRYSVGYDAPGTKIGQKLMA